MPRRDGAPTNVEMLTEFTDISRQVFVTAFGRQVTNAETTIVAEPAAAFEGKFLTDVDLVIDKVYTTEFEKDTARETLYVSALPICLTEDLDDALIFRNRPVAELAQYKKVADRIAEVIITPGLDIVEVVPSIGVNAVFSRPYRDEKRQLRWHTTNTFDDRPRKSSIVGAQALAADALDYVQSDAFVVGNTRIAKPDQETPLTVMGHELTFRMTPDLALNGHESDHFLRSYAQQMFRIVRNQDNYLAELTSRAEVPNIHVQHMQEKRSAYLAAVRRANDMLAQK